MTNRNRGFIQLLEPVTVKETREKGVIVSKELGGCDNYTIKLDSGMILRLARSQFIRIKNMGRRRRLDIICSFGYTTSEHENGLCHYLHVGNERLKEWY